MNRAPTLPSSAVVPLAALLAHPSARPLQRLAATLTGAQADALPVQLPGRQRRDEVGQVARNVEALLRLGLEQRIAATPVGAARVELQAWRHQVLELAQTLDTVLQLVVALEEGALWVRNPCDPHPGEPGLGLAFVRRLLQGQGPRLELRHEAGATRARVIPAVTWCAAAFQSSQRPLTLTMRQASVSVFTCRRQRRRAASRADGASGAAAAQPCAPASDSAKALWSAALK